MKMIMHGVTETLKESTNEKNLKVKKTRAQRVSRVQYVNSIAVE